MGLENNNSIRKQILLVAAIGGPGLLLLTVVAIIVWLQPRCLVSHVEQRWVDYYCETVEIASVPMNDISVPIYGTACHEAHWEPITVCDQWEVER